MTSPAFPCRVECREEAFWDLLSPRYAEFASDAVPQLQLRVEVTALPSDDVVARWSGPFARIAGGDGVLSIEGAGFGGIFDERSGQGWIAQPLDPSPLETFLTAIYAGRLLRDGGFFLHAAAMVRANEAYVFFGPSESGKTTVAGLVGEGVITDEIVAVRRDGDRYQVSGVPWRGQRLSAPLAGLFRLRKAPETSFARLAPVEAVRQPSAERFLLRRGFLGGRSLLGDRRGAGGEGSLLRDALRTRPLLPRARPPRWPGAHARGSTPPRGRADSHASALASCYPSPWRVPPVAAVVGGRFGVDHLTGRMRHFPFSTKPGTLPFEVRRVGVVI